MESGALHVATESPPHTARHTKYTISRNNVRARVYISTQKNIVLNIVKMDVISKYCRNFAVENINKLLTITAMKKNARELETTAAIRSISRVAAYVRTERKGANATIRILLEAADNNDVDAINTLCALCDTPTDMLHAVTLDNVRAAVNEWYPYVIVTDEGRKINVRAKSVHYTSAASEEETQEQAKKRIVKGFYADEVTDYLTALTQAARARAKGQKQVVVAAAKVYDDNKMASETGVTVDAIKQAIERKIFSFANVNVWRKNSIFGFYI